MGVAHQRYGAGYCHHQCATRMEGEEPCFGFSMNSAGDCEFYLEPVSTSEGSENNNGEDFMGCWIKGISCGGHTAIDCAHCPTLNSEHPEMECNGQCIYDY